MLPVLLAAMLWIEGTLGNVCAAEPVLQGAPVADADQTAGEGEPDLTEGNPDSADKPAEEEGGNEQSAGEVGAESAPGEGDGSEEAGTRNPEGVENAPGADDKEKSGEEGDPAPGEPEIPDEGEEILPGGTEGPDEAEEEPAGEETDAPTVSENTAEDEEDGSTDGWSGEPVIGEPPLMAEAADGYAAYSYHDISPMAEGIRRQTPGVADIIGRYKAYPWSLDVSDSYSVTPSVKDPYKAGYLKDESLQNALNLLNFIRYVAGLPTDVTLSEDYTEKTQAGALLNRVNGKLDHFPTKPEGFPDDLYKTGYEGCSKSNIAVGYGNLAKSLLNGWMYDGDASNINTMGHRRWVLNPAMTQTGFGAVGSYSAMYAHDSKGSSITDYIAWPARNMPIELMNGSGTPWTLSLGSDYEKANFQETSVTLTDIVNNKSWTFSGSNANGVFKVNVEYYGMPNCIVFRPNNVSYSKNSQFQVTVSGIKRKDGQDTAISYNVDFFSLKEEPAEVTEVRLHKGELHFLKGVEGKQEETLLATVAPGNARDKSLTWTSKDESVATVNENGRVTAVGVGTTEISAKAKNGLEDVCTVKVSDYTLQSNAVGFTFDEETETYGLAFDLTMNAKPGRLFVRDAAENENGGTATDTVKWISENESVVMVDQAGYVTPMAVGETLLWADVADGLAVLECRVKVEDSKLPQIEMREQECTLAIKRDAAGNWQADSRKLQLYFTPTDSKWVNQRQNYVKWTSSDPAAAAFATERADGTQSTETETISGNTVTVTAVGAGQTKISAVIVDEEGNPVTEGDGKRAEASCTVTVQAEAEPADSDIPRPIVLTDTQTTLRDVKLPAGWSWKEPDTALTQFTGGKTKKLAALYQPEGAGENVLPAERLLEVCFLTVENISLEMRAEEGKEQESAVLTKGQNVEIYVNHSAVEALKRLDENENYKNNTCYKEQRDAILNEIEKNIIWNSSRPDVLSVELVTDGGVLTAEKAGRAKLVAKNAGSATVKASLRLGGKTFHASLKLAVKEPGGTLMVKSVERFTRVDGADSGAGQAEERYEGLLSAFRTENTSKIALTLPGATKVTAKSGNAKVVAVKSSAAEGDGFVVSLIVRAAGTAELTLTGNDAARTSRMIRLVVGDAEPGLSDESVTVNVLQAAGAEISLYPAKSPDGKFYEITSVTMASDAVSAKFELSGDTSKEQTESRCRRIIKAKSDTKTGTYKVKIRAVAGGTAYELPLTVKVVSKNPVYKVKQVRKLNLFYKNDESLLQIETDETIGDMECTGLADYSVEKRNDGYYLKAETGATVRSVKKGRLQITFEGWRGTYTTSMTVDVENKAPKLTWDTNRVTMYPQAGIQSLWIGIKNPGAVSWDSVHVEKNSGKAKGNYTVKVDRERGGLLLSGKNLNQADSFKMQILLSDTEKWAEKEKISYTLQVKVSLGQPAIALGAKTIQLNADTAYRGYDAVSTEVKWKDGGVLTADQGVRVSVYCDSKDAEAKNLVGSGQVVFSVKDARVFVRLNNKAVESGSYKYIVQAAKNGRIWKTPLTLKVVNTAPDKAVKLTAKGSIDVLDRDGSFMTLTPVLKAVSGEFVIPEGREVKLTGRDAHLFRARWSEDGKAIELRAKRNETLVIKYQYTVTPLLTLRNVCGVTEEITAPAVKFKVKQGSVKVSVSPKTALVYSGAYNSVEIDMHAALRDADAPEIERVALTGNTDAFAYVYNKEGKGTLTMKDTGRAVMGKNYSLQFKVSFAEQADNVKPVTVRVTVKVK